MSRVRTAALFAIAVITVASSPASAKLIQSGEVHDTYDYVHRDFCGMPGLSVSDKGTFDQTYRVRTRGREQVVYYSEHIQERGIVTHTQTGRWVSYFLIVNGKDLHVTDNRDGTVTTIGFGTGAYTVKSPDGKVIGRNPGQFRSEVLIDTNGTPFDGSDDKFLAELSIIKESTGRNDDLCAAFLTGLGLRD